MSNRTPIAAESVAAESGSGYPEPFRSRLGHASWRALGDHFGLSQFGLSYETLEPGAQSSVRHWHTIVDEFAYRVEGELVLRTRDGEFKLLPGLCAGLKGGDKNAHHRVNRSASRAKFIVVGTRLPGDVPRYPDGDLAVFNTHDGRIAVHKDGAPYA